MKLSFITIPEIIEKIEREQLLIPHLQRNYVWRDRNIYNFLDSIMRNYPFPPFYFWNKRKEINARTLIKNYEKKKDKTYVSTSKVYKGSSKWLILDGQQRIQSLYLALVGSKDNREMYLDFTKSHTKLFVRDGSFSLYNFKFLKATSKKRIGFIKVKELFNAMKKVDRSVNKSVIDSLYKSITNWKELMDYADENDFEDNILDTLTEFHNAFINSELYHGLIKDEDKDDEVFNIFTRINNGGIKLTYADIIFIYFKTFWPKAQDSFADLLYRIPDGFSVDYEFLIKTSITLFKNTCEFDISKIDKEFVEKLKDKDKWKKFSNAVITAFEILHKLFIYDNSTLRSNISLIPVIYAIYHNKLKNGVDSDHFKNQVKKYIYSTHLKDVFSSKPETIVNKIINSNLKNTKFDANLILDLIIGNNHNINKSDLDSIAANKNVKMILNLLYFQETNFLTKKNSYSFKLDIDHIFPESDCRNYYSEKSRYNNIMNYCYLSGDNNRRIKLRTPPDKYFNKPADFNKHLLPKENLFKYDVKDHDKNFEMNFERFKKKRLTLILNKVNRELK